MKNYGVSKRTLLSIWQELNKDTIDWSQKWIKSSRQVIQSDWITNSIKSFVCSMKYLYSAQDVSVHLHKAHGMRMPDRIIRKVLN